MSNTQHKIQAQLTTEFNEQQLGSLFEVPSAICAGVSDNAKIAIMFTLIRKLAILRQRGVSSDIVLSRALIAHSSRSITVRSIQSAMFLSESWFAGNFNMIMEMTLDNTVWAELQVYVIRAFNNILKESNYE